MLKKITCACVLIGIMMSCQTRSDKAAEIAKIPVSFKIERFDKAFAQATPKDLPRLKKDYSFLFPKQYNDSIWIDKMSDTLEIALHKAVEANFPDLSTQQPKLRRFFQHMQYYFPEFKTPRVITITSDVDYRHRVISTDSLLLISLDCYLGADHKFYAGIYDYIAANLTPAQILPNVAENYAKDVVPHPTGRTFLDYMVYHGKIQYVKAQLLPKTSAAEIMGYTEKQMQWTEKNERNIWGYFIQQEMLYSTNSDLRQDFFAIGPYTKFGLKLDYESPAQLGQFIGWQIVKQYMASRDNVDLRTLLKTDNTTIFKQSNYKPKQN